MPGALIDVEMHADPGGFEATITDGGPGFDTSNGLQVHRGLPWARQCGLGLAMIQLVN